MALVIHQQSIDTTTPAGRMFFQVAGAFAEFERALIRQRVNAGLDRARAKGVRLGRPKVGNGDRIRAALAAWTGNERVARSQGVGVSTVMRVSRAMDTAVPG